MTVPVPTNRAPYVLAFLLIFGAAVIAALLYYRALCGTLRAEAYDKLRLVAELKVSEIRHWRTERMGDAASLANSPALRRLVARALADPPDPASVSDLRTWLAGYRTHLAYDRVSIVDVRGRERLAVPDAEEPSCPVVRDNLSRILQSGDVVFLDIHTVSQDRAIRISAAARILAPGAGPDPGRPVAAVVMRMDPGRYLFPLIKRWPSPSPTSETLLVRRDGDHVLYLNELRLRSNTALRLRLPLARTDLLAAQACLGATGAVAGTDYRGEPVFGYVLPVQDTPWFLVARVDQSEVFGPARRILPWLAAIVGMVLITAALSLTAIGSRQRRATLALELEAARALTEGENRYRLVLDNMAEGYLLIGSDCRILYANRAAAQQLGTPVDGMVGRRVEDCFPGFEDSDAWRAMTTCLAERRQTSAELRRRNNDGEWVWLAMRMQPVPEGVLVLSLDVSVERRQESELALHALRTHCLLELQRHAHESEENMLDAAMDAALKMTSSTMAFIGWMNEDETVLRVHRWSREAMAVCAVEHPSLDFPVANAGLWADVVRQRSPVVVNDYSADHPGKRGVPTGHVPLTRFMGVPVLDGERVAAVVAVANSDEPYDEDDVMALRTLADRLWGMAERRQATVRLMESEQRFRTLAENMAEGLILHEMIYGEDGSPVDYRIVYANPAFARHTGLALEKVLGRTASEAYGSPPPFLAEYARVADTGEHFQTEVYFEPMRRHFRISAARQRPGGFATVFEDITSHVERERELAEKTTEMQRFTYAASHDLRSPLVTITTFLGYLKEDLAAGNAESALDDIVFAEQAATRISHMLDELLRLSRVGRVENAAMPTTFHEVVRKALAAVAGPLASRGIYVDVIGPDVPLSADVPRLVEVVQNLLDNAAKFVGEQKDPRIEIGAEGSGRDITFFVRDNGIGIEPRHQSRIFDMFDKLDPRSSGMGVGLALVKRIVELHGGTITVESEGTNRGTCFRFTLPGALR